MEIRFRVWDGEKMWYPEDGYMQKKNRAGFPVCSFPSESGTVAMLSTGLKDKNGREIWEGDAIQCNNQLSGYYHRFPITFADGRFKPVTDTNEAGEPEWLNIEVLGNIHETPEMLSSSSVSSDRNSSQKAVQS